MLVFDPVSHTYRHPDTNEEYISATTLLNKFKKKFDVDAVSKKIAEKEGVSQEEVKERWRKINSDSKVYGSKIHTVIETYNNSRIIEEGYEDLIHSYKDLGIVKDEDSILVEEKLHNHFYKVAGTADIVKLEDKGGFSVFDLKTNKKFNMFSQYSEYFLKPLTHLTACEYTIYALQLSLYAFMFQTMSGRRVNQLGVIYYNKENNNFSFFPTPYMRSDILTMLDYYAENILG